MHNNNNYNNNNGIQSLSTYITVVVNLLYIHDLVKLSLPFISFYATIYVNKGVCYKIIV